MSDTGRPGCGCGCGQITGLAKQTATKLGWIRGQPLKFLPGHRVHARRCGPGPNPSGLCQCGCGGSAPRCTRTDIRRGAIAGQPVRFIAGHQGRIYGKAFTGYVVDDVTGCWNWSQNKDLRGYARIKRGGRYLFGHRWTYEAHRGRIPDGLELDHLCRNVSCVNPDHLEAVTPTENKRRSRATKLTAAQVAEIKASTAGNRELAARFSVDPSNISHIRRGFSWRDIDAAP